LPFFFFPRSGGTFFFLNRRPGSFSALMQKNPLRPNTFFCGPRFSLFYVADHFFFIVGPNDIRPTFSARLSLAEPSWETLLLLLISMPLFLKTKHVFPVLNRLLLEKRRVRCSLLRQGGYFFFLPVIQSFSPPFTNIKIHDVPSHSWSKCPLPFEEGSTFLPTLHDCLFSPF